MGKHEQNAYLIAEGVAPSHGTEGWIEVLVEAERRAGTWRPDGSADFRETDLRPEVLKGQEVARMYPATPGKPGKSVQGKTIPGRDGPPSNIKAGLHISTEEKDGLIHFYAESEGVLRLSRNNISIVELLVIDGDINYKIGNLEFEGEIFIKGSVGPNFKVVSESNIVVGGNIESGAMVMAKGNITVGKGILGRKTRVIALGNLQAQFVQDAHVQCGRNLYLGSYANLAYLRAGSRLKIDDAPGQRGGSLVGGQAWAYRSVDVCTAGTPHRLTTQINVGLSPDQAEKLEGIEAHLKEAHKLVVRYLQRFGLDHVDVAQIQNILTASTGPRRRILALSAKQLGQAVQLQQKLVKELEAIKNAVDKIQQDTTIIAREKVMPGVLIRLGDYHLNIQEVITSPRFRIQKSRLVDR